MQRGGIALRLETGAFALLTAGLLGLGCGGKSGGVESAADARIRRPTEVKLEKCEVEGSRAYDADSDGRPEVRVQSRGGKEVCRMADLDSDGRLDRTTFLDGAGQVRRIESDFDRDGRVDEIALFEGGVLKEKLRATTLSGKLDTWEFYAQGKIEHTERDKNGDGVIDQWWEYPTPSCPLIHSDGDGDGRPDPSTTIDYCKVTGYVPPEEVRASQPTPARDFEPSTEPREVREISNVSEGEAAEGKTTPPPTPAQGAAP
jgi:hypothetical protein